MKEENAKCENASILSSLSCLPDVNRFFSSHYLQPRSLTESSFKVAQNYKALSDCSESKTRDKLVDSSNVSAIRLNNTILITGLIN